MSEIILSADDVYKTYFIGKRPVEVLHGVSLEMRRGETVSVMGASGAGKSTLLHLLGGLDRPDAGDILFEGLSLRRMSPLRRAAFRARRCGFIFQSYHLLPELDVRQNVMLPAMAAGTLRSATGQSGRAVRERAAHLLEQVGLADRIDHRPMELSGGEQQRVAVARALMNDPDLVLADEPTGNLDSQTGEKLLNNLFEMAHSVDRTLIIVTHNGEVAQRCRRRLVLKDGKLEE